MKWLEIIENMKLTNVRVNDEPEEINDSDLKLR